MKNSYSLLVLLGAAGLAQAQVTPDAGSLLQQIEKNRPPPLPQKSPQDLQPAPAPLQNLPGVAVTVTEFRFQGNRLIGSDVLRQAVAPFVGRPLTFQELQNAALAVADAYRQQGWIVRAYLPRQEIDGGIVTIQIVEALFGGARSSSGEPARMALGRIIPYVASAQATGAPLNAEALDRALLIIDDLPGVGASGNLAAGEQDNETLLVMKLTDEPLFSGDAGVDNTGTRSTGAPRATANLALSSPLRIGDQAIANLIHSEGSDYGRVAYSIPVGTDGWRVGASASHLKYRLVADEFAALHAKGSSSTAGLDASYPLLRSRLRNLFLQLNYDNKRFDNQANGLTNSHYQIDGWTFGLSGNLFDNLGGGGANTASISVLRGKTDLDGSPNQLADAAGPRAGRGFTKLRYSASRQQAVTESVSLFAALSGQDANRNLDSSEKFYLGGNYGVRAYPASEAGGTNGQLINLEVRWRAPGGVGVSGFYDWGHVEVNRDNRFAGAAVVNNYSLKGAGVALSWTASFRLNLKAAWARRIGDNPNPNLNGSDQDGSLRKNRFWLQATMPF